MFVADYVRDKGVEMDEVLGAVVCPTCGVKQPAHMTYMTDLGGGEWCRCRYCGTEFTIPYEDADYESGSWLELHAALSE